MDKFIVIKKAATVSTFNAESAQAAAIRQMTASPAPYDVYQYVGTYAPGEPVWTPANAPTQQPAQDAFEPKFGQLVKDNYGSEGLIISKEADEDDEWRVWFESRSDWFYRKSDQLFPL